MPVFFSKSKSLKDALNQTKTVKIRGVLFEIKKINLQDYLNGSQVMLQVFESYEGNPEKKVSNMANKKLSGHYRDVFMSGVVKPELSRKENCGEAIYVDDIFKDGEMAMQLYQAIIDYTYGKKKILSNWLNRT